MIFSDVEHNTYAIGIGKLAVAGFYLQAQVITYIKSFQVSINSCIHHIQSPEKIKNKTV